jgi:hypothetical protein
MTLQTHFDTKKNKVYLLIAMPDASKFKTAE